MNTNKMELIVLYTIFIVIIYCNVFGEKLEEKDSIDYKSDIKYLKLSSNNQEEITKYIILKHILARDVERLIIYKFSPRQIVQDGKINAFIITDTLEKIKSIELFLGEIDKDFPDAVRADEVEASGMISKIFYIKNISINKAIDHISRHFRNISISFDEKENILIITGTKQEIKRLEAFIGDVDIKYDNVITEIIPIYYKKTNLAMQIIRSNFNPKTIDIDEANKYMIITDTRENINKIVKFISEYDIQPPTILVEGTVLKVNQNKAKEIGIKNEHQFARAAPDPSGKSEGWNTASAYKVDFFNTAVPNFMYEFTSGGGKKYAISMGALMNSGAVEVILKPHITFVSGETGVFEQNQNTYIKVGTESNTRVETISIGLTLHVGGVAVKTGENKETGKSKYKIVLNKLRLTDGRQEDTNYSQEIIFESTQIVDDGELIIIGGAINKDINENNKKIPILGDIPILNILFSGTSKSENTTETLALLRLTVVEGRDIYNSKAAQFTNLKKIAPIEFGGDTNDSANEHKLKTSVWSSKIIYEKDGGFFERIYNKISESKMEDIGREFEATIRSRLDIIKDFEDYALIEKIIKEDSGLEGWFKNISEKMNVSAYEILITARHLGLLDDKTYIIYLNYLRSKGFK